VLLQLIAWKDLSSSDLLRVEWDSFWVMLVIVALMGSMRSLDASCLPLNREQFLDLASSLNEFFTQNGLIKSELDSSTESQQMMPPHSSQMPMQPATSFCQQMSPQCYQNYPGSDDQMSSPGMLAVVTDYNPLWNLNSGRSPGAHSKQRRDERTHESTCWNTVEGYGCIPCHSGG